MASLPERWTLKTQTALVEEEGHRSCWITTLDADRQNVRGVEWWRPEGDISVRNFVNAIGRELDRPAGLVFVWAGATRVRLPDEARLVWTKGNLYPHIRSPDDAALWPVQGLLLVVGQPTTLAAYAPASPTWAVGLSAQVRLALGPHTAPQNQHAAPPDPPPDLSFFSPEAPPPSSSTRPAPLPLDVSFYDPAEPLNRSHLFNPAQPPDRAPLPVPPPPIQYCFFDP